MFFIRFIDVTFLILCFRFWSKDKYNDTRIAKSVAVAILYQCVSNTFVTHIKKYNQYKFKRYKNDGICYDCTIIRVIPINMVRIGSYLTVRIECTCKLENSIVNVISGLYLLSPWDKIENLNAKIYMKNNKKYILVLFRNRDIFKV